MTVDVRFLGQPFRPEDAAASFVREGLDEPEAARLSIAVAWARFGGLVRIADDLRAFRERGGRSTLLTGVDEGVATRPGLALALLLFDEVLILHDTGGRTFHPKLYLIEGDRKARLAVGSSNLTAGGLYFNFEASLEAHFHLPDDETHPALMGARAYLEALRSDTATRLLTPDTLEALAADPRYRIAGTERRTDRSATVAGIDPAEVDNDGADRASDVEFQPSSGARTFPPPLDREQRELLRDLERPEDPTPQRSAPTPTGRAPAATVVDSWSKVLNRTDAQHPPNMDSNPTGNLRLSKARHAIDHRTWFRYELFGRCNWHPDTDTRGNPIETALVEMQVSVQGAAVGSLDLRVDHASHREAGQNNVPTILHWGPTLAPLLRAANLTGSTVTIARLSTNAFQLTIG